MTERPIDFRRHEVLATLAGRQTQFRRPITRARVFGTPERKSFTLTGEHMARALQNASGFRRMDGDGWFWESDAFEWQAPSTRTGWLAHIGHAPGDSLWVREAAHYGPNRIAYSASNPPLRAGDRVEGWGPAKRANAMPRWASRLTLEVTSVKVERLQDISEADAIAEGVECDSDGWRDYQMPATQCCATANAAFRTLWTSINGSGSWAANPWVLATTFQRVPT